MVNATFEKKCKSTPLENGYMATAVSITERAKVGVHFYNSNVLHKIFKAGGGGGHSHCCILR